MIVCRFIDSEMIETKLRWKYFFRQKYGTRNNVLLQ